MKKTLLFLFAVLVLISPAMGDGAIWSPYRWELLEQNEQRAVINYQDGVQKMIIAVDFKMAYDKAVWIFPIPARPEKIKVDIVAKFPALEGTHIKQYAEHMAKRVALGIIYPFFIPTPVVRGDYLSLEFGAPYRAGVVVHQHLEKEGVTAELVTAESGNALYNYLSEKGLNVQRGTISVLDSYIGKEYSFVVVWISKYSPAYASYWLPYWKQVGVFVTFPTDKVFYPLLPTSVYGDKSILINLYLIGYFEPKAYPDIKAYVKTDYYIQHEVFTDLKEFFGGGEITDLPYTQVKIRAPSKYFADDLWFEKSAKAEVINFFVAHRTLIIFILLTLSSAVAGIVSGFVVYREIKRFALIGLANVFTIIGVSLALLVTKTGKKFVAIDERKLAFIIVFSLVYLMTSSLFFFILPAII